MTKTMTVLEKIRDMIRKGQIPDGQLPGERELAVQFQVGRNTVRAALAQLEQEGWIERHRKKGTLIRDTGHTPDKKLAGLIMRATGHLYEDCFHHVLTGFIGAGYSVQAISTSPISNDKFKPNKALETAIRKLLNTEPEILVVDGYVNSRIPLINEIRSRHPIMLDFYDSPRERDFTGVWFDYRKAGYLAGKYLIGCGCRKPVFFSGFVPPCVRFNPETYIHHSEKMAIEGFRKAMTEGGIDPETAVIASSATSLEEHYNILYQLSSHIHRMPDGFCGARDILTVSYMKSLLENRGEIPKDMVFVGIGNTPWSMESAIYPFTSVDLHPEKLAQAIVQQAKLPPEKREDIFIEPTLNERHVKIPAKTK